jgi:serine/threonine-protein kinase RsbW
MSDDGQSNLIRLELPAAYRYLNILGSVVGALLERVEGVEARDTVRYNIELALHETCTNVVEHAYGDQEGRISVVLTLEEQPRRLVMDVSDTGRSFDLSTVQEPDLEQPQTSGYGLFLVHRLVDTVSYHTENGKNRWRLIKNL